MIFNLFEINKDMMLNFVFLVLLPDLHINTVTLKIYSKQGSMIPVTRNIQRSFNRVLRLCFEQKFIIIEQLFSKLLYSITSLNHSNFGGCKFDELPSKNLARWILGY